MNVYYLTPNVLAASSKRDHRSRKETHYESRRDLLLQTGNTFSVTQKWNSRSSPRPTVQIERVEPVSSEFKPHSGRLKSAPDPAPYDGHHLASQCTPSPWPSHEELSSPVSRGLRTNPVHCLYQQLKKHGWAGITWSRQIRAAFQSTVRNSCPAGSSTGPPPSGSSRSIHCRAVRACDGGGPK